MPLTNTFLRHYVTNVFIETGTWKGGGVYAALSVAFPMILTVELDQRHYDNAVANFFTFPKVRCYYGDSADFLERIADKIQLRSTFWLDAHYSGLPDMSKGRDMSPIIRELRAIAFSPVKNHIILIDDVRLFGQPDFDGTTLDEAKAEILKINPAYQIKLETGCPEHPNDVLVAQV